MMDDNSVYWVVLVTFLVGNQFPVAAGLGFSPGSEYWYSLEATTHVKDAATISIAAQVGIIPMNSSEAQKNHQPSPHQLCRLMVHDYQIDITQVTQSDHEKPEMDFSKCLLFDLSEDGEVVTIYYDQSELPPVLTAKKTILDLMSSKLVISRSQEEKGQRWGYGTNEIGHGGPHSAVYQAEPSGKTVNFVKTKTTKALENGKHTHVKKIAVHRHTEVPQEFHVEDEFQTVKDSKLDGPGVDPEFMMDFPVLGSQATSRLKLDSVQAADKYLMTQTRPDLMQTTLLADPVIPSYYNLSDAKQKVKTHLSCVLKYGDSKPAIPCFRGILTVFQRVTFEDLASLVRSYRNTTGWLVMIDALGGAATENALFLLTTDVLQSDASTPKELMHALIHLVQLENCPPKLLLHELRLRAFEEPWSFSDDHATSQVNDRTKLVVGALVSTAMKCNQTWADGVTRQLEGLVGVHDPWHHRQLRSTMTQKEMREHLAWKSVHIYALGNAGQMSSYNHLVSYLNTTETHMQLRFSAVAAVASYEHPEAAELLLQVALTDTEDNVRRNAKLAYKKHPHGGGDLDQFIEQKLYRFSNVTDVEHRRMRRGLKDVLSAIWKGFEFNLATPSMDWQKVIGGSNLGASFGLIIKNELDIKISPLAGHLKVDVHDAAWATLNLGILGFDFDIFKAEICFKGKVEYNLNILAEYSPSDVKALADIYNNYIKKIVDTVKESINNFKGLVETWKGYDVSAIWVDFVDAVKNMPVDVQSLRKVARKVLKQLEEYADLPPVYTLIKNLVQKVTNLFNDIKSDVMTLYNAIVDTVSTTIPWAWDEIKSSFNDIIEAFKNILKGPKTAMQNIGKGAIRISIAVAAVLDAKDKIVEANIFDKDNRPYWFDFKTVIGGLYNDTLEIKDAIDDSINWLSGAPTEDEKEASRYTGVDLKSMKKQALLEVWSIIQQDLLQGPLDQIKRFLDPFLQTYQFFTETVNNIKEGWRLLLEGYQSARTLLDTIFGPKLHKGFPRKYLESTTCGEGFWESTGQTNYKHTGVDIEVDIGSTIVAPFNGYIYDTSESGKPQVTMDVEDLKNTQVILDNVEIDSSKNRQQVGAGDVIGTVANPKWCLDGHVHFSMRKTNVTGDYINPSRYLERREMPIPKWVEECDHYKLVWLGKTISSGVITKDPELDDQTPAISNAPPSSDLNVAEITQTTQTTTTGSGRKKRALFNNIADKLEDFTKSLGLPGFDRLKEIFSLNINKITLGQALDILDDFSLTALKEKIIALLLKVETFLNDERCSNPKALDDNELRAALTLRGKSAGGSRQTLINRYLESETTCFGLQNHVQDNIYCSYHSDCLGMTCCLDLKFFIYRHSAVAFVRYEPCIGSVVLGVGKWTKVIEVSADTNVQGTDPMEDDINVLNIAQLLVTYKVKQDNTVLKVSLGVRWCSTQSEECQDLIEFIKEAQLEIEECDDSVSSTDLTLNTDSPTVKQLLNTTIYDVIKLIEYSGIDEDEINAVTGYLREAFQIWLRDLIENALAQIFGDEFSLQDMCMKGYDLKYGPYKVVIFKSPPITMTAGPVVLKFQMGLDGYYGADFSTTLCALSMKAVARITPRIGSGVWGSLSASILVFAVELKLTGYVLTTSFPTKAEVEFNKFPLDVRARMDMQLIPLHIELHVIIKIEVDLLLTTITKTIFSKKLWSYTSPTINKNIFNLNNAEPDESPPAFDWYSRANCTNCDEGGRKKRQAVDETPRCVVYQVVGRDYTDPAYVIELAVEDDKSPVNMTYCVGTFVGGCDLVQDGELSGTTTITAKMVRGLPLYFKITAKNNGGMAAYSTCNIATYDMTLPTGRVLPNFKTTSHPDILKASVLMTEDSVITDTKISLGYGDDRYGFQVLDWMDFTAQNDDDSSYIGSDPLSKFTPPKAGKLPWEPFYSESHDEPEVCAQACLAYPVSKCQGFNYDYDANGLCELLDIVEGEVELQQSSLFYYFERRGIGKVGKFDFDNLQLQHDKLVFFNVYVKNNLDYTTILSSEGVLIDLTTPEPGYIANASIDETNIEPCTAFTPEALHPRCNTQTPVANYRYIMDGEGSMCLFNGHEPLVDERFTRANKMASANWDGIHDDETDILIYTWSVGQEPCGFDIHPHNDPHAHLSHESEWSHIGVAYPLDLEDGAYYMSIRALNKVEFGGPLALTLCHYLPLVVDNSPPVIHEVGEAYYDELTMIITTTVNASDDLSLIEGAEFGLGSSPRDTYLLEWQDLVEYVNVSYTYQVPDGIPVWVKIRVTNHVELKTVGYSPRAIFVDLSAPLAGDIYHGDHRGYHRLYQWESDTLCVVWEGFNDPDSGISEYLIALGTSPDLDDIQQYTSLPYTEASYCFTNLSLQHNTSYYVTMIAFNGASDAKNVSDSSQGVLIDLTPPVPPAVKDGLTGEPDIIYSSDPATIKASWQGFSDPESGLDTSQANILRTLQGSTEETTVHTESLDPNTELELELHHMNFYHGDEVRVSVSVTNGAGSSSEAESDGFMVDLTDPVMFTLVDGGDINVDKKYTASLTELTASWNFEDPESGIVNFKFTVYSKVGGKTTVIYPPDGMHRELESSLSTWTTDEALNLTPGGFYYIRLAALNGAGLTAVHDTDGVIVDASPPTMLYVYAGVASGESEQIVDGYVWQNSQDSIQGSWKAIDPESGITEYRVSVGIAEGDDSILTETSVGTALDSFIEALTLTLTDSGTIVPVYYINVVAVNGAGMTSASKSSTPIRVVKADQAGVVWDGTGSTFEDDKDFGSGRYSVTLQFSGFESELNGISRYLWALGSQPRSDNIKVFSDYGIITGGASAKGLGSEGKIQEIVQLDAGVTYYATVRAITGDGSALDSSSDGFMIDSTPPEVSLTILGATADDDYTNVAAVYRESTAVEIQPGYLDSESGISSVWLSVGSYKGGDDIADQVELNNNGVVTLDAMIGGQPTYFSISAKNHIGLAASVEAPVVVVDQTVPEAGQLTCPSVINKNDITCSWSGTFDSESGIDNYRFGIGSAEGSDNIIGFYDINRDDVSVTMSNNGELTHNVVYYATLSGINNVGMNTFVYSNTMIVDDTPPTAGWVIELNDFAVVDAVSGAVHTATDNVHEGMDVLCQRDITKVEIAWQEFTDEESNIDYYDVALGSTPGGTQLHDFVKIEDESLKYTFYPVDLAAVRQVFASVRGFNGVGLFSVAVSDGVYISKHSAGLPPLNPLVVLDGHEVDDIDYQYDNDRLYAHWDLRGDPCPVKAMDWTIHKFDGTQAASSQQLSTENAYAEEDGVSMNDGDSFFVELRVTNALGYSYSIHSDGVTIQLEPLIPGEVKDGPMIGVDLNYQPSTDTLYANWDGFGSDKSPETFSDYVSDVASVEIGAHQAISHYEVAVGTDRRYPTTRNDIHPFINVGLNKTWTFPHLSLTPLTAYYYITVRAYSLSTTSVEVTSNGIRVGYGGHIVALGEIRMNDYTTTQEEVSFSWSAFEFPVPILRYYIGLKAGITDTDNILDCSNMMVTDGSIITISDNFTSLFDVYPLTDVGINTFMQLVNLSLPQGSSHTVFVVALDESGTCAMIGKGFMVDTTPPVEGRLGIGPDIELAVLYVPSTEEFTVWWEGYGDDESGLMEFDITLMLGTDCDNFNPSQMTVVVENQVLSPLSSNFTYLELALQIGEPYYLVFETTNNAELTIQTVSRPIIVDINGPTAGRVIDGTVYQEDLIFHGDPNRFEGRILYLPDPAAEACPYRTYEMTSPHADWNHIVHKGMWTLPSGKNEKTVFLDDQITYDANGITITMEKDITTEQILSGALYTGADIARGASYEFDIKAASEMYGVTSVAVVDWTRGIMSDFYSTITSGNATEQQVSAASSNAIDSGFTVVTDALNGDTYPGEYALETQLEGDSFGFHIVKDQGGVYHVLLWALTLGSNRTLDFILDYDPTTDFHTYSLLVNDGEIPDTENDWSIKLLIDGQYRGEIVGISAVGENATIVIGLYNNHGLMDETGDIFIAQPTTATFKNFRFSASSTELCRYGTPFIGGDHSIVEFYAGIGSEAGLDDVLPFQLAAQPCIPCLHPCDDKICDNTCDASVVQLIDLVLDGIQLEPAGDIQIDNITLPAPYYLSVKGMTGSGKLASASSNGFYIDVTAPFIGEIYHIDMSWNDYEPSIYQGSNSSIAAYWEVTEDESKIGQYFWAIGTTRFGTDIQDFVDAGTNEFAFNDQLEGILQNNSTYYVTIKAINVAGLMSTNSSKGITTSFEEPDVSQTPTSVEGATPIGDSETSNVVSSSNQNSVDISWEAPAPSQVETTYCSIGSTPGQADIFPETPCGLNGSGSLTVNDDGFGINGENQANLSDVKHTRRKRSLSQFRLEPGKVLYPRVRACTRAHKCNDLPMSTIIVQRTRDNMLAPSANGKMTGRIVPNIEGGVEFVEIATLLTQSSDQYLIVGALTDADFQDVYKTEATTLYKPYIVDPSVTIQFTSRGLEGRITQYLEGGFYLTGTPGEAVIGPVRITVKIPGTVFSRTSDVGRPVLLTWCDIEEIWVDVSESCSGEYLPTVDWESNILVTYICDIRAHCSNSDTVAARRKKRQTDDNGFTGPGSFVVAAATDGVINDPPVIITDTTYSINEDAGTISFVIAASDPDDDDFAFLLDDNSAHIGNVTLDSDGQATYKPCQDCFGMDEVSFVVREVRTDDVVALETAGIMRFTMADINDNPVLVFIQQGEAVTGSITIKMDEYKESNAENSLRIGLVSYDVDQDSISFTIDGNQDGTLRLYGQPVPYNITQPDCGAAWSSREGEWDSVVESIQNQIGFTLPVPCGLEGDTAGKSLTWATTVVEYTPNRNFLGMDTVKVVARDEHSAVSQLLTFNIYVLANPCENNATCIGPSWDADCTDTARINGFDGYTCGCVPGYTGPECEENLNECISSPCPTNFSCVDQVNAYNCICQDDNWPCSETGSTTVAVDTAGLDGWLIGVIAGSIALFLILVFAIAYSVYKCCSASPYGSERERIIPSPIQDRRLPLERENRRKNLVDSSGRPLKVVSARWLDVPSERVGHENRAYDRASDYYTNYRADSPRISERVVREEPRRHGGVYRAHSDRSVSTMENDGRLTRPVKRWVPRHVVEEGGLYSSGSRHVSRREPGYGRGNSPRLERRSRSASDLRPRYSLYGYA